MTVLLELQVQIGHLYNVMNDGTSDPELLYELISFYTYQLL
mgnify:CR=1 FL=1